MKYLFFDTESSNCLGGIYKLCEYGFFTTDESFQLLPDGQRDILINPGQGDFYRFRLKGRKDNRDIELAHPYEEYYQARYFPSHHPDIWIRLHAPDTKLFFWSGANDVQALLDSCRRYNLRVFAFTAYDVQILYMAVMGHKNPISIEKAMEELGISMDNLTLHQPDNDAMMAMLVLRALCEKTGKSVDELIDEVPKCVLSSRDIYRRIERRRCMRNRKRNAMRRAKAQ